MMKNTKVDMLSGSIYKGLISMAIPIMIMNVMQNMFSIIDMSILGKFTNDTAVGAVGACGTLITLITGLLIGISSGANVLVAKCIGAGKRESTEKAIGTAILFALVGGFALLIIGMSFAEAFLKMVNCPKELLPQAILYFRLYFIGVPMIMIYNFSASILRASGDTKRPMYYLIIGGFVKVILNYCCVMVFDMTVEGVAIATIASNIISGGLAFFALVKNSDKASFRLSRMRFYSSELKEMLFIGVPAGMQTALYSLANTVIATAVNSFGADATTGIAIANQFDGVLYQISTVTAFASMPYIAQNIGAGNLARAKKAIVNSVVITVMFGAGFGALSAIFCRELSSVMSSTPAVIEYSCQKMVIVSSTYFICGINEVMGGTLRGLGRPVIPTISTLVFMCLIRFVWVYDIFPLYPNLTFLYLIWPIGWVLSIITQLIAYFPTMRKLQKSNSMRPETV